MLFDRVRFAFAFLRDPHRWSMAGLAVVFGTVGLVLADGFIERIFEDFREEVVRSHFGHVQVVAADGETGGDGSSAKLAALRPDVERALRGYPGSVVAARLSLSGLVSFGERTVSFIGEGVEPERERTLSSALVVKEGRALSSDESPEALIGEGLARTLGVRVGDVVTVLANVRGGGVNAVELEVVGLFYTTTKAYDNRAIRLPLSTAKRLVREDGVSRLIAVLPRTDDAVAASEMLTGAFADQPVKVLHWTALADFYNKTVQLFSSQLAAVRAVIVAIVLLSVSNTLARGVMERTSEIGTMMALGRSRAHVARSFFAEGLVIGLVGGVSGVVIGWVIALIVSAVGIPMPPPPGMARGFIGGIAFTPGIAASAFAVSLLIAAIASVIPAVRASRLNLIDALRSGR